MTNLIPPVLAAAILSMVAGITVWAQQPLLAPSLGAAVFTQVLHANEKSAAPYNLAMGQIIGCAAGFCGVFLAGQAQAPDLLGTHHLPVGRILAVAIASVVAVLGQMLANARTPTGGATALVVALGIETPTWDGALRLLAGITLVITFGELSRRLTLQKEGSKAPSAAGD